MVLEHMVWLTPKAGVSDDKMEEILASIRALTHIPGVLAISAGRNITGRANGATHGVLVTLETADDLLGGATSLQADAALWEDFLSALRLSSPLLANRIRRELMRRRSELVEAASKGKGTTRAAAVAQGPTRERCSLQ